MSEGYGDVAGSLGGHIGRVSGGVANDKMGHNCGGHVKFAYVPQSAKACGFCCMMASRGFVFSVDAEPKLHNSCSCKLIPETAKHLLDGYDPDAYYTGYKELFEGYRRDKEGGLVPAFKQGYVYDTGSNAGMRKASTSSGVLYLRKLEKRDGGSVDYSRFSKRKLKNELSEDERRGHQALAEYGFTIEAVPIDKSMPASVDMFLDEELWELKTLGGTGSRLSARLYEGISKWERLHVAGIDLDSYPRIVVDARSSSITVEDALDVMARCMYSEAGIREKFSQIILLVSDDLAFMIEK